MKLKIIILILTWILLQGLMPTGAASQSPGHPPGAWNWPPRTLPAHPEGVNQAWFTGFGTDTSQVAYVSPTMVTELPSQFSQPLLLAQAAFSDTTIVRYDWDWERESIYTHELEPFTFLWVDDSEYGFMCYIYSPYKDNYLHYYVPIEYAQLYEDDMFSFQFFSPIHNTVVIVYIHEFGFEVNYHLQHAGLHITHIYNTQARFHKSWAKQHPSPNRE